MTAKKGSLEDILGSPEEYRAGLVKRQKEWDELCATYRAKLLEEQRLKFESTQTQFAVQKDAGGKYELMSTHDLWTGWQLCIDFNIRLKFDLLVIVLPNDALPRDRALEDFAHMVKAYCAQVCRTWGPSTGLPETMARNVERMAAHAKIVLPESEYEFFRVGIVNHGGTAECRSIKFKE